MPEAPPPRTDRSYRTEHDSMGEVRVPADVYWGAQTQRALEHFRIGSDRFPRVFLHAYGLLKRAAAEANAALGELDTQRAGWIAAAAQEVADGAHDAQFPLVIWQTGSGTHTHMNVNEVVANRANELAGGTRGTGDPVHPNDHVNRGQSTNDTFPTVMHVSAALEVRDGLLPALDVLRTTLDRKADEYADLIKIGRTHLQDATPLTLGQEISGWSAQLGLARDAITATLPAVHALALGGTAVGTGLNAHPRFAEEATQRLAAATGLPLRCAPNRFAALAGHEPLAALSGALAVLAGALLKVANDVRWLASGPRCGIGELRIPANEPGSSIMPGKVNPTQAEALTLVCVQVLGHDSAVKVAASQGNFELNVYKPVIAHALLHSLRLLSDAMTSFERYCARGIEADRERIAAYVERSLMLVTALTPHIGYEAAARIAKTAYERNLSLREAALQLGLVSEEDYDRWVRPEKMIGPRSDDPA